MIQQRQQFRGHDVPFRRTKVSHETGAGRCQQGDEGAVQAVHVQAILGCNSDATTGQGGAQHQAQVFGQNMLVYAYVEHLTNLDEFFD